MITEMRAANKIVFELILICGDCYLMRFNFSNCDGKKPSRDFFFEITDVVFVFKEARTFSRPFCPNLRFCFARVHMLGLRA